MEKPVTIEEAKEAVALVYRECNGNLPLQFKVRNTVEELYGHETVKKHPRLKESQGAYLPRSGLVTLACSNILYDERRSGSGEKNLERNQGVQEALTVVRHEVLGHYGLNTCSAEQKRNILETIVKNKEEPGLQKLWDDLGSAYSCQPIMTQAEEVFCFAAEDKPKLDINFSLTSEPFTLKHVEQIAARIAEGIRLGERTQQIFPGDNQAQFSKKRQLPEENQYSTDYRWSTPDKKMIVTINDKSPSMMDAKVLRRLVDNDRFLSSYSLEDIQSGKLDLKTAKGVQPVPKTYNKQGTPVTRQEETQALKLK